MPKLHRAGARIDSSLYLAAMQSGIPADVVVQMIHMFSYEVDFQRDLSPGFCFEVLYNYYYTPDGRPAKQGDITYAAMHLAGRTVQLYRFEPHDGGGAGLLQCQGPKRQGMLMKTPVDGARISSGFGMRFHPCSATRACTRASISPCRSARPSWRPAPAPSSQGLGQRLRQFHADQSRQHLCDRLRPSFALRAGHAQGQPCPSGRGHRL